MAGFDPDSYLAGKPAGGFDPDAYLRGNKAEPKAAPAPTRKPMTLWEIAKQEAKPDIFNTSGASYDLGGKVTDALAPHVPASVAGGAGYLANVAGQALPVIVGAFGGSAAGKPLMEEAGRRTMQSAIRPQIAHLRKGAVPDAIETMLQQGHSPTNAGIAAMRDKVGTLSAEANNIIAPSNKLIDLTRASQNVAQVADKARMATTGVDDAGVALDIGQRLLSHPAVDQQLGTMSVQAAQAMKQANYAKMGEAAYGMGLKPAAERDALKAVTAALKTNIERAEPAVAPVNAKISELINAIKVSQSRALMEGNKDIIPLGSSVATALNNPIAALGLYANSSAAVKAMLARALYSGANGVPAAAGGAVGAAIGAESGSSQGSERQRELARMLEAR